MRPRGIRCPHEYTILKQDSKHIANREENHQKLAGFKAKCRLCNKPLIIWYIPTGKKEEVSLCTHEEYTILEKRKQDIIDNMRVENEEVQVGLEAKCHECRLPIIVWFIPTNKVEELQENN